MKNSKQIIKNNVSIQKDIKKIWKQYRNEGLSFTPFKEKIEILLNSWYPKVPTKYIYDDGENWIKSLMRQDMRLLHIAHSMSKGRSYEQIENPKEENKLNNSDWDKINAYIKEFSSEEELVA